MGPFQANENLLQIQIQADHDSTDPAIEGESKPKNEISRVRRNSCRGKCMCFCEESRLVVWKFGFAAYVGKGTAWALAVSRHQQVAA